MMIRRVGRAVVGVVVFVAGVNLFAAEGAKPQAAGPAASGASAPQQPMQVLTAALNRWAQIVQPPAGQAPQTFVTRLKVTRAEGVPPEMANMTADLAFQAPDRLRVSANVKGRAYSVGRDGQQMWVDIPHQPFALLARAGVPRFKTHPDELDATVLPPLRSPVEPGAAALALAWATQVKLDGPNVLHFVRKDKGSDVEARLWLRDGDLLPLRVAFREGEQRSVEVEFENPHLEAPWPAEKWKLSPAAGTKVETVALGHLLRFHEAGPDLLFNNHVAALGPATGERRVVAREGEGRLEMHDGTRVLFLKGSPAEMGRQHGVLLRNEIHHTMNRILYGVGVGSSFVTGRWFFGEIESAQARVEPYCDPRYLAEMDAIADAVGAHRQEGRLANFFPELFHCSGFSIFGKATKDGRMYHGRILDYMKGVGLEQNAVVIVHQPDGGRNAWVNVSYAGFVGSVTAMNEKHISIGEMGGRGYGDWDGKPMAQLVRDVMEKANTLDEAVEIMRKGPRTCEYYYVISDGKTKDAVGIAATPTTFETIRPGQSHPRLPHAVPDAVLLSADERYEELARRVKAGYGKFDAQSAMQLMTRPVCMTSNIHSVLFAPDTLELWVANADSDHPASHTRFTHYDLADLLKSEPTAAAK
jgi:hypothetical protein